MFCSTCGTRNSDDANFCEKCGSPVEAPKPLSPTETLPQNGNCPQNNLPQQGTPKQTSTVFEKKKKRSKATGQFFLFAGLVLVVAAFILGAGVLSYKWYEVPFSIFRIYIYRDIGLTLLSFFVPCCVYGGGYMLLAGIGTLLTERLE